MTTGCAGRSCEFPTELPLLVKLMVEHGLATSEKIPVNQVQVHLEALGRDARRARPRKSLRRT